MQTKVKAEFNLSNDYLNIPKITELMGISPTVSYIKGEPIENRKSLKWKETLWAIETEYEETWDINTALEKVVCVLRNKVDTLVKIKEMYDADIFFVVVVDIVDGDIPVMSLSNEMVSFMASLGARIDFCIYI